MAAIKSQQTRLYMETEAARAAAVNITALTSAFPAVATATAHGYADGDVVYLAAFNAPIQLNDRAVIVDSTAASTFAMLGVDSRLYDAYTSGGTAQKCTMLEVANITDMSGLDGEAADIDVTHLRSFAKEYLVGLQDPGNFSFNILIKPGDSSLNALYRAKADQVKRAFEIRLSDGTRAAFMAFVKSVTMEAQTDNAVRGSVALRISGEISIWAAPTP